MAANITAFDKALREEYASALKQRAEDMNRQLTGLTAPEWRQRKGHLVPLTTAQKRENDAWRERAEEAIAAIDEMASAAGVSMDEDGSWSVDDWKAPNRPEWVWDE